MAGKAGCEPGFEEWIQRVANELAKGFHEPSPGRFSEAVAFLLSDAALAPSEATPPCMPKARTRGTSCWW